MTGEDYKTERNGIQMNISKAVRIDKAKIGQKKFEELKLKYDIEVIENKNNIIRFIHDEQEYYYGVVSRKIRKAGEREWTTKISQILKNKNNNKINQMNQNNIQFKERFNFGKYKGKEVKWVIENDPQYYKWCLDNVKKFKTSIHWKGYTLSKKEAN
jgi:hypothetical protein